MVFYFYFRFEWSVGLSSGTLPDGIYTSVDDRVWHDAAQLTSATFSSEYGITLVIDLLKVRWKQ